MATIIIFLLGLVVLPIIILFLMLILEVISDILFFMVKILDKITGHKTERRIDKDDGEY